MTKKSLFSKWTRGYKAVVVGAIIFVMGVLGCFVVCSSWLFGGLGAIGVDFSVESGFYKDEIDLEIRATGFSIESPLIIRYNMNGDNLNDTYEEYNDKIRLEVPDIGYALYTVTATVCDGEGNCVDPKVATYVMGKSLDKDVTLGIININCSQYDLYDYYHGIMVGGATYDLYSDSKEYYKGSVLGNYNNRGRKWMRESYFVMINPDGTLRMDNRAWIGISGGTFSAFPIKSMKVVVPVESGARNGEESFHLRSGSQDQLSGNIRSSIVSRLVEESDYNGGDTTERVVVFLNGVYYGIFDMQSSYSGKQLARKFDIKKDSKIRKYKGSELSVFDEMGIGVEVWNDLDTERGRRRLEDMIDMEDYLRYYAIQILANNTDWPMGNYGAWRYEGKGEVNNEYTDGKVRFLIYDTDVTYYADDNIHWSDWTVGDIFEYLMEEKYSGDGSVFRKVMESEYYRNRFIEILRELINGPFRTENVLKIIDEEAAKIDHQVELWSTPEEYEEWKHWIEVLRGAAASREQEVRDDVFKYFGVVL